MTFWNGVKSFSAKAGSAALVAGQKTKLRADLLLVDREINARKQSFGVELYDHSAPLASHSSFWEADDPLTNTIRPALLKAQREIAALDLKRGRQKERIAQAEVTRQSAFPTPAATLGGKVMNVGKSAGYRGNEAKLRTELNMIESQIKGFKQQFGVELYEVFMELEDNKGWLPTDRTIRSMYDQTRRDIEAIEKKRVTKKKELVALGAAAADKAAAAPPSKNGTMQTPGTTIQPGNGGGFVPPLVTAGPSYATPATRDSSYVTPSYATPSAPVDPFAVLSKSNYHPQPSAPSHEDLLLNFEYAD
jgi:hypothetical protein